MMIWQHIVLVFMTGFFVGASWYWRRRFVRLRERVRVLYYAGCWTLVLEREPKSGYTQCQMWAMVRDAAGFPEGGTSRWRGNGLG